MFCKQCGKQLDEGQGFCPNCGFKVEVNNEENINNEPVNNEPTENSDYITPEAATKTAKPGKKKLGIIIGSVAGVVAVGVAGAFVAMNLNTQSPEDYFKKVVKDSFKGASSDISKIFNYGKTAVSFDNLGAELDAEVTLGEGLKDLIYENAGSEVSDYIDWIDTASFGIDLSMKDMLWAYDINLAANGTELGNVNLVMDFDEGYFYATLPEISDKTIGGRMFSEHEAEDFKMQFTQMKESMAMIDKMLPEAEIVEKILNRYVGVIVDEVDKVEKSDDKVTVGDVTQKCTRLAVTLDGETGLNMLEAVLREAKGDKDIKNIIRDYLSVEELELGVDADEAIAAYEAGIEEALGSMGEARAQLGDTESVTVNVWVDDKGQIIGISEEEFLNCGYFVVDNGKEIVASFEMKAEGVSVKLEGNGTRNGNLLDMEYVVEAMGMEVVTVTIDDFDEKKAEQGLSNGTVIIEAGSDVGSILRMSGNSELASVLSGLRIECESEQTSLTEGSARLSVYMDDEMFGEIKINSVIGESKDITVPADYIAADNDAGAQEWVLSADLNALLESLDEAGAPGSLTAPIEQAIEMMEMMNSIGYTPVSGNGDVVDVPSVQEREVSMALPEREVVNQVEKDDFALGY